MGLSQQDNANPLWPPSRAKPLHHLSSIKTFSPFRSDDVPCAVICEFQSHHCASSKIMAGPASQCVSRRFLSGNPHTVGSPLSPPKFDARGLLIPAVHPHRPAGGKSSCYSRGPFSLASVGSLATCFLTGRNPGSSTELLPVWDVADYARHPVLVEPDRPVVVVKLVVFLATPPRLPGVGQGTTSGPDDLARALAMAAKVVGRQGHELIHFRPTVTQALGPLGRVAIMKPREAVACRRHHRAARPRALRADCRAAPRSLRLSMEPTRKRRTPATKPEGRAETGMFVAKGRRLS